MKKKLLSILLVISLLIGNGLIGTITASADTTFGLRVTTDKEVYRVNETVTVTVRLENNPHNNLSAMGLLVDFEASKFEYLGSVNGVVGMTHGGNRFPIGSPLAAVTIVTANMAAPPTMNLVSAIRAQPTWTEGLHGEENATLITFEIKATATGVATIVARPNGLSRPGIPATVLAATAIALKTITIICAVGECEVNPAGAADCTSASAECINCGGDMTQQAHDFTSDVGATYTHHKCARCAVTAPHDWEVGKDVSTASLTEEGETVDTCKDCDYELESSRATTHRTPPAPTVGTPAPTNNTIVLTAIPANGSGTVQYRRSTGVDTWTAWQLETTFGGLAPNTGYTFQAQFTGGGWSVSANSAASAVITTLRNPGPGAPAVPAVTAPGTQITATSITLDAAAGVEFSRDNGATWQTAVLFDGLTPDTQYTFIARVAQTDTYFAGINSSGVPFTTDKATLGGTVAISGDAVFGQTLTAVTTGLNSDPTVSLGALTYQWRRGGADIVDATSATYTLVEADVGAEITVAVDSPNTIGDAIVSPATAAVAKATQNAPTPPTEASKTDTSITLTANAAHEFRLGATGTWQASSVFDGLTPNSTHTFYARIAATATHDASPASTGAQFTTNRSAGPGAPAAPTEAGKTATSITLTPIAGAEFSRDNGATWQDSNMFSGLTADTPYTFIARIKQTQTHLASANSDASEAIRTDKATLGGTVTIQGNAVFGQTLTAVTTGLNSTPTVSLGTLTYQWRRGETVIAGATNATYALVQADIGATITVTVSAANTSGSVASVPTATVTRATQSAPAAPAMESKTATSITLTPIAGAEFRLGTGGTWQASNVFSGLAPNSTHTFFARFPQTDTQLEAVSAASAAITTDKATLGGTVTISGDAVFGEELTAVTTGLTSTPTVELGALSFEWLRGETVIADASAATYTLTAADVGTAISVKVTAANTDGTVASSPTSSVDKADQDAPEAPTMASRTTTSITLDEIEGAEYGIWVVIEDDSEEETEETEETEELEEKGEIKWQDSPVFEGLTANTEYIFYARFTETDTHKTSPESESAEIRTVAGTTRRPSGGGGGGGTTPPPGEQPPAQNITQVGPGATPPANFAIPTATINNLAAGDLFARLRINTTGNQAVNLGADAAGQNAILVRLVNGQIEIVNTATFNASGQVTFNITATGDYLVLARKTGDITGTGDVGTGDALELLRHIAGLTELNAVQLFAANGKAGDKDTSDALNILRFVAGVIDKI
jgi:hypothetical protein